MGVVSLWTRRRPFRYLLVNMSSGDGDGGDGGRWHRSPADRGSDMCGSAIPLYDTPLVLILTIPLWRDYGLVSADGCIWQCALSC
jgi:hypothetical protein